MNILLIRLSAIGDVVFASPMIHAFRDKYPEAKIYWLVQPEAKELLEHHPELDGVIIWPKAEWQQLWKKKQFWALFRALLKFRRNLRQYHFDLAVDMQGLMKSGIWAWLSGARKRIGLGSQESSGMLMTKVYPKPRETERICSEYRFLARRLGLNVHHFPMHIELPPASKTFVDDIVKKYQLDEGYGIFCPFTTRPQKHWRDDGWQELAKTLNNALALPIIMLGGPGDQAAAKAIAEGTDIIDLSGQTSLLQAAALIEQSQLLVGVDTGLTHLGTAYRRPTVCIFGSTCPYLITDSPMTNVVYHKLSCSPCRRAPTCKGEFTCINEVPSGEVMRHVLEALSAASR